MSRRMDRQGSTPLTGMGKCAPCKRDDHSLCPKRAIDSMTGEPTSCYCADVGHRTDHDWMAIFE